MRKCIQNYIDKINKAVDSNFDEDRNFYSNYAHLYHAHLYNEFDKMHHEISAMYWSDFISNDEQEILQNAIYDARFRYEKLLEQMRVRANEKTSI